MTTTPVRPIGTVLDLPKEYGYSIRITVVGHDIDGREFTKCEAVDPDGEVFYEGKLGFCLGEIASRTPRKVAEAYVPDEDDAGNDARAYIKDGR